MQPMPMPGWRRAGLRVLAVAVGHGAEERDLELLGLVAIADPPRPEAIEAVAAARRAGITTVMITGDHRVTARRLRASSASSVPMMRPTARCTPGRHLRTSCPSFGPGRRRDAVVAMTGDGVNDAPGASRGPHRHRDGTRRDRGHARSVGHDSGRRQFREHRGRRARGPGIFENIRKSLVYLLSGNTAELVAMLVATVIGLPLPLLPVHLLWINIVTDGLPALALVMDPADEDVLSRPPRSPAEPMLARAQWNCHRLHGPLEAATTLSVFVWALRAGAWPTRAAWRLPSSCSASCFAPLRRAARPARSGRSVHSRTSGSSSSSISGRRAACIFRVASGAVVLSAGAALIDRSAFSRSRPRLIPVTVLEVQKLVRRAGKAASRAVEACNGSSADGAWTFAG